MSRRLSRRQAYRRGKGDSRDRVMADKKTKKKRIKKPIRKTRKTVVKKVSQKTKPKTAKKKIKKIPKKTLKTVAKKIPKKTKPKPGKKKKILTKPSVSKETISKKYEEERKIMLRRLLINRREEILREAKIEISKYIKGETKQLVDTAVDNGDWSVVDLSEDISLKQLSTHRENLLKIDEVLRKLAEGTYGKCEDCGEDISEERLKLIPFAIYCVDCKEKREQLEKLQREDSLVR
jgi:DnaK suppressor protein